MVIVYTYMVFLMLIKKGMHYDLPSVKFIEPYLNIDNVRFENPII